MDVLVFRCPRTGREVESGIEAHPNILVRLFSVRLRCPACEELHEWRVIDARLLEHHAVTSGLAGSVSGVSGPIGLRPD